MTFTIPKASMCGFHCQFQFPHSESEPRNLAFLSCTDLNFEFTSDTGLQCEKCGRQFNSGKKIKSQYNWHCRFLCPFVPAQFQCQHCNRPVRRKSDLINHEIICSRRRRRLNKKITKYRWIRNPNPYNISDFQFAIFPMFSYKKLDLHISS